MHEQAISFIRSKKAESVGILGLSYKPDEKSEEYSPVMKIIEGLAKEGISVRVNDPNYTAEEIETHTGAAAFSFPEGLEDFDLILLFTGHTDYRAVSWERLSACCKAKWILDNTDSWSSFPWESLGATCNVVGGADWRG